MGFSRYPAITNAPAAPIAPAWFTVAIPEIIDPKTKLQEYSLKKFKLLPIYKFISDTGPKHQPSFKVAVKIKSSTFVEAEGSSKKLAQQAAANKLLNILEKTNEIWRQRISPK